MAIGKTYSRKKENAVFLLKMKLVTNFIIFLLVTVFASIGIQFFTLLHSERPKLYTILAFLSAVGLKSYFCKFAVRWGFPF